MKTPKALIFFLILVLLAAMEFTVAQIVDGGTANNLLKLETFSNKLEFNENLTSIITSLDSSYLSILNDGTIVNEYGIFDYKQTLYLPKGRVAFAKDSLNLSGLHVRDAPKDYLLIPKGSEAYKLKISFSPALKSDHNTANSGYLEDLINEKIMLFGKEYRILKANHAAQNSVMLKLMAGNISDVMSEGETKTYMFNGNSYAVTLDFVGSVQTKFTVNGEITDALEEGDIFVLNDSTGIGVADIISQEFAGGTRKVEFYLGAISLALDDNNTRDVSAGGLVTLNKNLLNNVKVDIKDLGDEGTGSGADVYISFIEIYYSPKEDLFVAKGENASAIAAIIENQPSVFFDAFDIKYGGLSLDNPEEIKIRAVSNNDYKLEFINKAGIKYSIPVWAQASGTANITVGDNIGSTVRNLNVFENQSIVDEDYFLVSRNKYSRIMQFKDIDPGINNTDYNIPDNSGNIKIKDVGSGDLIVVYYSNLGGDLVLDGNTYKVNLSRDATSSPIWVDLDGSGNGDVNESTAVVNQLYTKNGALIQLGIRNTSNTVRVPGPGTYSNPGIAELGYNMSYAIFSSEKDEDKAITNITIVFGRNDDNELDIARIEGTDILSNKVGDLYLYEDYIYDETPSDSGNKLLPAYGYFVSWDKKTANESDQDDLAITYPDNQTFANVYVTPAAEGAVLPPVEERVETFSFGASTPMNGRRTAKNEIILNVSYPATETMQDTLSEGESKTYSVAGKDYAVTADFVGSSEAILSVNNEVTSALSEGQKHIFSDNSELALIDISSREFGGGIRKVTFNFTATKAVTLANCTLEWNGMNESINISLEGCLTKKQTSEGQSYTFQAFLQYSSGALAISDRRTIKENSKPTGNAFIATFSKSSSSINAQDGEGGSGQTAEKLFYTNNNLSCENRNLADSDGDNVTVSGYDWFNGTAWIGINSKNLSASHTWKNQEWKCAITLDDSYVQVEINSSAIKISNAPPVLVFMQNITINEAEMVNLTPLAGDIDNDTLFFFYSSPIDSSGQWRTSYESDGVHIITVTVSDGFLNDSQDMEINVLNIPVKGNISNISTNINNLSMIIGNFSNVSLITGETVPIKFVHGNITLVSFDFNFSRGTLIFDRIKIEKQLNASTGGYVIIRGINLSKQNLTKSVHIDNNTYATGICIKDAEISSIEEISSACKSPNEFWLACPGTNGQYSCEFNASISMWKVSGLNNSGVKQQATYCGDGIVNGGETCSSCPEDAGSCPSTSSGSDSGSGGGGGGSGGSGGAIAVSESSFVQSVSAGSSGKFDFRKYPELGISGITVSINQQVFNPRIDIREAKLAEGMPFPDGSTYKLISINKFNLDDSQISSATIEFKVPNSWMAGNNINPESIAISRLRGASWNKIETVKKGSDSEYSAFEAQVPGFSIFAITGLENIKKEEIKITETKQEERLNETKELVSPLQESLTSSSYEQLKTPDNLITGAAALDGNSSKIKTGGIAIMLAIVIIGTVSYFAVFRKRNKFI